MSLVSTGLSVPGQCEPAEIQVLESWGVQLPLTGSVSHGATGLPLIWTKYILWTKKAPRQENGSWQQPSCKSAGEIPYTWLSRWSHREPGSLGGSFLLLVPNVSGTRASFLGVSHPARQMVPG